MSKLNQYLEMAKKEEVQDHVNHFRVGGKVKINPTHLEDVEQFYDTPKTFKIYKTKVKPYIGKIGKIIGFTHPDYCDLPDGVDDPDAKDLKPGDIDACFARVKFDDGKVLNIECGMGFMDDVEGLLHVK